MRNFLMVFTLSFLCFGELWAQGGGNVIYQENNRYRQNKAYTSNQEAVWDNRPDNAIQSSLFNDAQSNSSVFTVNVLMNREADSYLAIFNITQNGKTAKETDALMNTKITGFRENLQTAGIEDKDIFIDMISLVPIYDYKVEKRLFSKTYTEVPAGFEMQKNIHIHFTDENMMDDIMTAAADNEVYDFIKLEYFVENSELVYETMRKAAIKNMNSKTEAFKELGFNFDTVYHILSEQSSVVYPIDQYHSYRGFTTTAIDPGKSDETLDMRKPVTMFYNKLPYHKYDVVINPEILAPTVQFTYSLKIRYINAHRPNEKKNKYFIITDTGEVKYIDLK
jgi:uncharacterized protein YggE